MSNETTSDKKQPAPTPQSKELTRIPVKHLYFADNVDIQGASQISNLKTWRDPEGASNYWTCDFIPAWNAFEIRWHRHQVDDDVRVMPALHVRTWKTA